LTNSVKIHQVFYKDEQKLFLDAAFSPLDNGAHNDETLEFGVFKRLYGGGSFEGADYFGALSWRFAEKTGLTGQALMEVFRSNPDVDLFYINPFPHNEAIHQSLWVQGETSHPGFLKVCTAFFEAAGLKPTDMYRLLPSMEFSVCNYFVARPAFWKAYIPFVERCLERADAGMPSELCKRMHSAEGDWKGIHKGATYVPFIIERLLPVFLRSPEGRALRVYKVPLPTKEAKLNDDLRELREMKDVAILARSSRILDLWREKREAYCHIYYSKAWCERNLKLLNDAPVAW